MPNMSYCRFENTLHDLKDCREALADLFEAETAADAADAVLSDSEQESAKQLLAVAWDVVKMVCDEADVSVDDLERSAFPESALADAVEVAVEAARDRGQNMKDDCCPSCGWEPCDGVNPRCDDEDGCGFWRDLDEDDDDEE